MQKELECSWLRVANDLKNDFFFMGLGAVFGLLQLFSYRFLDQADWGTQLLSEHIAFHSLVGITLILFPMRILQLWFFKKYLYQPFWLKKLINHLSSRAVALGSVAANVIFGFAMVPLITGAPKMSVIFIVFSLYLVSIAEICAHIPTLFNKEYKLSKLFYVACMWPCSTYIFLKLEPFIN
jgi:hypothetical protein